MQMHKIMDAYLDQHEYHNFEGRRGVERLCQLVVISATVTRNIVCSLHAQLVLGTCLCFSKTILALLKQL